jgi:diguanylate cyclase (GGDEF)-like protein
MDLIKKFVGSSAQKPAAGKKPARSGSLEDEALDTLGCVIRVMGDESFPLGDEAEPGLFPAQCKEVAKHVENGSAAPLCGIPQPTAAEREWPKVRGFFTDRRKHEKEFVSNALENYRGVVNDLVSGLKRIGQRDKDTEASIRSGLGSVETIVDVGSLPEIKAALSKTIEEIDHTFAQQKKDYEAQINELNEKMSNLRQDLVATLEQMKRDPLTEVYNRAGFDSAIQYSVNMRFIANQPGTLVMIDVDYFKEINDRYGHSAGDDVLRAIATCLQRSFIRKSDLVCRFGGDEFSVILNDTTGEKSALLVERFAELVREVDVPYAPKDVRVTCSIGYTEISETDDVQSLLERADKALYQAKHDGRNCIRSAPHSAEAAARAPDEKPAKTASQTSR